MDVGMRGSRVAGFSSETAGNQRARGVPLASEDTMLLVDAGTEPAKSEAHRGGEAAPPARSAKSEPGKVPQVARNPRSITFRFDAGYGPQTRGCHADRGPLLCPGLFAARLLRGQLARVSIRPATPHRAEIQGGGASACANCGPARWPQTNCRQREPEQLEGVLIFPRLLESACRRSSSYAGPR